MSEIRYGALYDHSDVLIQSCFDSCDGSVHETSMFGVFSSCYPAEVTPSPPLKSASSVSISRVFVDPSGRHILFTTIPSTLSSPGKPSPKLAAAQVSSPGFAPTSPPFSAQAAVSDLYYLHATSTKPRHVAVLSTRGGVQPLAGLSSSSLSPHTAGLGSISIGGVTAVAWNPGQPSDCEDFPCLAGRLVFTSESGLRMDRLPVLA